MKESHPALVKILVEIKRTVTLNITRQTLLNNEDEKEQNEDEGELASAQSLRRSSLQKVFNLTFSSFIGLAVPSWLG